jgi:Outer membrane protein
MKKIIILFIVVLNCHFSIGYAQLTIESCQEKAKNNYPLVKQYGLIEQTKEYNLSNANKGYLPQFTLSGKATYQSEVTKIPVTIPGVTIKGLNKDQYQSVLEMNQTIWDGGVIQSQKQLTKTGSEVEKQKNDVDLYTIKDRVNQLYFGILLFEEQLIQNSLLQKELTRNYNQIATYMDNGIANQADLDAIKVEQLNAVQRKTEIDSSRKAYRQMLSALIGEEITEGTTLIKPDTNLQLQSSTINRPELQWYEAQYNNLEIQKKLLNAKNMPKLGLFVQGGYSNPGLNMLKSEFSAYYVGGVRLSWNFGGFYTIKNDRKQIEASKSKLKTLEETFLFNTNLQITQQNSEIEKLSDLMKHDDEIITLRDNIKKSAEAKVENGTLSVTELLREINAGDQVRQTKTLHQIQLMMAIYNLKNTTNN